MDFEHKSVLLNECIQGINIKPDGVYVDGTTGGAGHSLEIAKRLQNGKLFCFDQDPDAIQAATERLKEYPCAMTIHSNFAEIDVHLSAIGISGVDGVLLDLGVSSFQLDSPKRGFSYMKDGELDMRMSKSGISAMDIVNDYSLQDIADIIRDYGEEKFSFSIAKRIVNQREKSRIQTTSQLAEIIKSAVPAKARRDKNPCKRTFQALRIAVNAELDCLKTGLLKSFEVLNKGGRLVVITFHSLEDRIVKKFYNQQCQGCICPSDFPVCVCGNKPKAKLINKKPIVPSLQEQQSNRRSKSAKLRILEKL